MINRINKDYEDNLGTSGTSSTELLLRRSRWLSGPFIVLYAIELKQL